MDHGMDHNAMDVAMDHAMDQHVMNRAIRPRCLQEGPRENQNAAQSFTEVQR